ncbi:MAG: hypothetical protein A2Y33_14130 [Spirochaetes bacterium GWF1_51_8]|nr:MAG: hypothetical protein A2Y33_14130 [Spirochaetes bacterium GWF1_51_8]
MKPKALLQKIFTLLQSRFGDQNWWPLVRNGKAVYLPEFRARERTPAEVFEIAVGAILTQNTAWGNVVLAIAALKEAKLISRRAILDTDPARLAELVKPSGYFNQKAKKLKALAGYIAEELRGSLVRLKEMPPDAARASLLSVWGIGKETADSVLLYGLGMPVFVIDAYTRRVFSRIGLIDPAAEYDEIRAFFEKHCADDIDLYREYHALIVAQGKDICRNKPLCPECDLDEICAYRKSKIAESR